MAIPDKVAAISAVLFFYAIVVCTSTVLPQQALAVNYLWPRGVAIANINDNPRPDMVILYAGGNPLNESLYYYRIAYDISSTNSQIMNGVTQPIPINSPFGNVVQVKGLAIANITDHRPDMVIIGQGPLGIYYKIVYNISSTNSQIMNGVTQWIPINSPLGGMTEVTGVTIANINSDPRPDMVIIGQGPCGNSLCAYYKIAYDISSTNSEIMHGVTQSIPINSPLGSMTEVTGVAIANISSDHRPDMVIFGDNRCLKPIELCNVSTPPPPALSAYYKIAYDISSTNSSIMHGVTQSIPITGSYGPMTYLAPNGGYAIGYINTDPRPDIVIVGSWGGLTLPCVGYRIAYDISSTNSQIVNGVSQPITLHCQ